MLHKYLGSISMIMIFCTISFGQNTMDGESSSAITLTKQKLTANDLLDDRNFGHNVSISGDQIVVGAPNDDNGTHWGSIYFFERNGNSWNQITKLTPEGLTKNHNFGNSVSISGNYAIALASEDLNWTESVYVYERIDGSWSEVGKLIDNDRIGFSISLSGDHAIIGGNGSARIFKRIENNWVPNARMKPNNGGVSFGSPVSMHFSLSNLISGPTSPVPFSEK